MLCVFMCMCMSVYTYILPRFWVPKTWYLCVCVCVRMCVRVCKIHVYSYLPYIYTQI